MGNGLSPKVCQCVGITITKINEVFYDIFLGIAVEAEGRLAGTIWTRRVWYTIFLGALGSIKVPTT
jgi:hypothetical protein